MLNKGWKSLRSWPGNIVHPDQAILGEFGPSSVVPVLLSRGTLYCPRGSMECSLWGSGIHASEAKA